MSTSSARPSGPLTSAGLLRFFLPLSLSDMIMVVSGPLISAVLGRLPEVPTQLAAYGVAQTIAILLESPVIMMLHAANAAAGNPVAYRTLGRLMWLWNGFITALFALVAFTPAYGWVAEVMLGLPAGVAQAARPAFAVMLLWPAAIGYRRYMQGQLIYHRRARDVMVAGFVRLGSLIAALLLTAPTGLPGAVVACLALTVSVLAEAAAVAWFARRLRRELAARPAPAADGDADVPVRLGALFWWYLPGRARRCWSGLPAPWSPPASPGRTWRP